MDGKKAGSSQRAQQKEREGIKAAKQQRSREEGVLGVGLQKSAESEGPLSPFADFGANTVNGGKRRPRGDELRDAGEQGQLI